MRKNNRILILKEYELYQEEKCFKAEFRLIFKPYHHSRQESVISREFLIFGQVLFQIKCNGKPGKLEVIFSEAFPSYPRTAFFNVKSSKLNIKNMLFCTSDSWEFLSAEHFNIEIYRYTVLDDVHDQKCFDISIHLKNIQNSSLALASLHSETELLDLELRGVDGSVFVHKAVLAGCSPVFRQMLSSQEIKTTGVVNVEGTKQETLRRLKDFIYLNVIPDTDFDNLLRIASCYMISHLEYCCTVKLLATISAETVPKLLELAVLHNLKLLMQGVLLSVTKYVVLLDGTEEPFTLQGYMIQSTMRMAAATKFLYNLYPFDYIRIEDSELVQNENFLKVKIDCFANDWCWYLTKQPTNYRFGSNVVCDGWYGYKYYQSNEYLMCGFIFVQIKAEWLLMEKFVTATISLKVSQLTKINNSIVTINVCCEPFNVNKTFDVDESDWRLIGEVATDFTNNFKTYCIEVALEVNIKESISLAFASLHSDTALLDLELRGLDGSVFVHKAVLAGCSPVFRQMLSAQYVQVQHATQQTLQQLKDFIYLRVLPDDMDKVVEIASYYNIDGLELQCIVKLISKFTAENVSRFMRFAIRYKMKELLHLILKSVRRGAILIENIVIN